MAPFKNEKGRKIGGYCLTATETKTHQRIFVANSSNNARSQPSSMVLPSGATNGKIIERMIHERKIEYKTIKQNNEARKKKSKIPKRKITKNTKKISKRGGTAGTKGRKQSINKTVKEKLKAPSKITLFINL